MNELNRRYKEFRVSLDLTQEDISQMTGVSLYTIKNFERGSDIKVSTLEKILKPLGFENVIAALIPDVTDRPSYRAKEAERKVKLRARKAHRTTTTWEWGE